MIDADEATTQLRQALADCRRQVIELTAQLTTQEQAQANLYADNHNLWQLFDAITDFIFILDCNGQILNANRAVETHLGYAKANLTGMHVGQVHPPEAETEVNQLVLAMRTKLVLTGSIPLRTKTGQLIPVDTRLSRGEWRGQPALFSQSKETTPHQQAEVIAANRHLWQEIKAQEQFEQELRHSEANYRTLLNRTPSSILVVQDGKYVFGNPAALRMLGYRHLNELVGTPVMQTVSAKFQKNVAQRLKQVAAGNSNSPLELELIRADGSILYIESASVPMEFEGKPAALIIGRDITTERETRSWLRKLSGVVEQTGDAVVITDKEGVIEYVNPAFETLTGYSRLETVGQTPRILKSGQHPLEFYENLWAQILAGQVFRGIVINKKKSGELFYEEKTISPLRDETGAITHFVSTAKDITARIHAEVEMQNSKQFLQSSLDALSANIAILSETGQIVAVNQSWRNFGQANGLRWPNDGVGYNYLETLTRVYGKYSTEAPLVVNAIQEIITGQRSQFWLTYPCHGPTEQRWFTLRLTRFEGTDGLRVVAAHENITEQILAQESLHEQERFLTSLNEITRAALDAPDLQTMFQILVKWLQALYDADGCHLLWWDTAKQTLIPVAATDVSPELEAEFMALRLGPDDPSVARLALTNGCPLPVEDIKNSPHVSPKVARAIRKKSVLGIPFIAGDKKLGAAVVTFARAHRFTVTEVAQAEQISQQIALALAKVQLLEETQLRWREAETLRQAWAAMAEELSLNERVERILEQLAQVIAYDSASVQLLRGDHLEIVNGRGFVHPEQVIGLRFPATGNSLNANVIKAGRPAVLSNVQRDYPDMFGPPHHYIQSWLGAPLIVREKVVGMFTVDSFEANHFTADHIRLVTPFANQVAIALENSQLYEQARQDAQTKATLLREVNHRVKNNLSAIIGLLYAERRHHGVKDDAVYQAVMQDLITRVKGISIVHNLLSAVEWTPLPLSRICDRLISAALHPLPPSKKVTVEITPSPVVVNSRQANNLALVINELATNSLKYALTNRNTACIRVKIQADDNLVQLEYRDDGPGYSETTLRQEEQQQVGLYLVQTLVRDGLLGTLAMFNDNGAVAVIQFKP